MERASETTARCRFCGCDPINDPCRLPGGEECGWFNRMLLCCSKTSCQWALLNEIKAGARENRKQRREAVRQGWKAVYYSRQLRRERQRRRVRRARKKAA